MEDISESLAAEVKPLAKAALDLARKKLDFVRRDFDSWKSTTLNTEFPPKPG